MAVWFNLNINDERLGRVEIRRVERLDLTDQAAIQNTVSTYEVFRDGRRVGSLKHRYGDRVWRLLAKAADLIADDPVAAGGGAPR